MRKASVALMTLMAMVSLTIADTGTITKVDPKTGIVTVSMMQKVKKKSSMVDKEYRLDDDAKVTLVTDTGKKEIKGKDALTELKSGTAINFKTENDLKIVELSTGAMSKKK